jgi:hypothetical protein
MEFLETGKLVALPPLSSLSSPPSFAAAPTLTKATADQDHSLPLWLLSSRDSSDSAKEDTTASQE